MLWLSIWFAAGIGVASLAEVDVVISLPVALAAAFFCVLIPRSAIVLIPIVFLSLGTLAIQLERSSIAENRIRRIYDEGRIESGEPVNVEGVVSGVPEPAYGGVFLLLRADNLSNRGNEQSVSGKVRLFIPLSETNGRTALNELGLSYGSRVRALVRLERDEKYQNPGVASRIQILDQQGIDATANVKSLLLIEKLGEVPVSRPLRLIYELREHLIFEFRETFTPETAGVLIASLLGDQYFLDRETSDAFRAGGTFHVLVISGLHVTFIGGLVIWLVSLFSRRKPVQYVVAVGFLWAYTFAVGAQVPVVRASVMFTIILFSYMVHRKGSQLNALGSCVLVLLVWRPSDLLTASFQLTVVSIAAIVACSFPLIEKMRAIGGWIPTAQTPLPPNVPKRLRRFCEFLYWNPAIWQIENTRQIWSANLFKARQPGLVSPSNVQSLIAYIFEAMLVSLIVQIWMLPLLVIYFHRVSPISILLNIWVGAFLALESFCALFAILLGDVSDLLAAPLIWLTEVFNALMTWLPALLSDYYLANFRVPTYPGDGRLFYVIFVLAVLTAAAVIFRWDPFSVVPVQRAHVRVFVLSVLSTAAIALVIVLHPFSSPIPDGRLKIDFLDVGQGDSALVTFPDGTTMLVDGGGETSFGDREDEGFEPDRRRIGEAVVSEFLWEKGYSSLDYLVGTHADADHIQGLSDVARNFRIGSVLIGMTANDDADFSELMNVVSDRRIAVENVTRGDVFSIDGVTLEILNPNSGSGGTSSNNSSVVMRIKFGSRAFLLTGDIEREAESTLSSDSDVGADVIKVPHHGSRTSSTRRFLDRVGAETAVISVGRRSRFGHPHQEVVARWLDSGAEILRTGEMGTITISTDGRDLRITAFVPREK